MRTMILYNPVSGRGRAGKLAGDITEMLLRTPCDVELIPTQKDDPMQWLKPRLQCPPDAVVVVGGDGTLRQAASVLAGTKIPVYHAASGTENLFSKSMGMIAQLEVVVETILHGETQSIDTAIANGEFMLLMASVGFDAAVVADLAAHRGSSITHFSYILPCVRQLLHWNPPTISITVDGEEVVTNTTGWAVVANSKQYARGLNPARNASVIDGELDIVFLPLNGRLRLFKWLRWMKRGTHLHHPEAIYVTGKQVVVKTSEPSPWQVDGDPAGECSEMKLSCAPNSLLVFN